MKIMILTWYPLLLNIPIIVTLIIAVRYFIGYKTWRITPVLLLSLAWYLMNLTTLSFWQTALLWSSSIIIILGTTQLFHILVQKQIIHAFSRLGFIYWGTFLAIMFQLTILKKIFSIQINDPLVLAMLFIGLIARFLIELQYKTDRYEAYRRIIVTIILAIFSGFLLTNPWWNVKINNNPLWVMGGTLIILIFSARTNMLKLTEFIRFQKVINHD